eukprot:m.53048 g.53048  ORF g.53048 m.53048 type:complete len:336 (-) comp13122_c0_seq2:70-1077(-)
MEVWIAIEISVGEFPLDSWFISLLYFLLLPLPSPALDQERLLVRVSGVVHRERDVVQLDVVKVGGACLGAAARTAADGEEAEEELAHHNGKERKGGVDEHAQAKGLLGDPVEEAADAALLHVALGLVWRVRGRGVRRRARRVKTDDGAGRGGRGGGGGDGALGDAHGAALARLLGTLRVEEEDNLVHKDLVQEVAVNLAEQQLHAERGELASDNLLLHKSLHADLDVVGIDDVVGASLDLAEESGEGHGALDAAGNAHAVEHDHTLLHSDTDGDLEDVLVVHDVGKVAADVNEDGLIVADVGDLGADGHAVDRVGHGHGDAERQACKDDALHLRR